MSVYSHQPKYLNTVQFKQGVTFSHKIGKHVLIFHRTDQCLCHKAQKNTHTYLCRIGPGSASVFTKYLTVTRMTQYKTEMKPTPLYKQHKTALVPIQYKHSKKLQRYQCHDTVISQLFSKYLLLHMMWNKVYKTQYKMLTTVFSYFLHYWHYCYYYYYHYLCFCHHHHYHLEMHR